MRYRRAVRAPDAILGNGGGSFSIGPDYFAVAVAPLEQGVEKSRAKLVTNRRPKCDIDLHAFDLMNATCFRIFVGWIGWMRELSPQRRYRIVSRFDPNRPRQTRSLHTLSCFATELVSIKDA